MRGGMSREFEVIVFGATGFTGRLVAAYLATAAPDLRWAIAGRRADELARIAAALPDGARPACVTADARDGASLAAMAARTKVIVSTAGPFAELGPGVVAACVAAGTHYADLTGEVTFVRAMIDAHHEAARAAGARIVPCSGFDSIPSDLGTQLVLETARARGVTLTGVTALYGAMRGGVSGGTVASMLGLVETATHDRAARRVLGDPYALTGGRRGTDRDRLAPGYYAPAGLPTAPFVMAAINSRVVRRSRLLLDDAPVETFRYDERMSVPASPGGAVAALAVSAGLAALPLLAAWPTARALLRKRVPAGTGPSPEAQARGKFALRLFGETSTGVAVRAEVRCDDADPGYLGTARMLGETARCLARDQLTSPGGVTTPAAAMGAILRARLDAVGIRFTVEP